MTTQTDGAGDTNMHKVSEVAGQLKCHPGSVYGLIRDGHLRAIRVGRLIRVPESALAEFIAGR